MLAVSPIIFGGLIITASLFFGIVTQGDVEAIAESVPRSIPIILLMTQIILLLLLLRSLRTEQLSFADIGWRIPAGQKLWVEILIGSVLGAGIGLLYPYVLAPLIESIQKAVGDYVPPGETLPALGSYLIPFFIANVLLAPFVEESVYRGYAITKLSQHYGQGVSILITCVFFGMLHWAGGFWYMILTGGFLGIILAGLYIWRRNLIVPFTLHLVLNMIEFIFIMQGV